MRSASGDRRSLGHRASHSGGREDVERYGGPAHAASVAPSQGRVDAFEFGNVGLIPVMAQNP
jgi:hypothetical protein